VPLLNRVSDFMFLLHTGVGAALWAVILGISTLGSIVLMFLGFIIAYHRLKTRVPKPKSEASAEYVILYGSENGETRNKAIALYQALQQEKPGLVYIADLNQYQTFPKLKQLIILTATYGEGEAPSNATEFLSLLQASPPTQAFQYSILGFGSLAYPEFCKFAQEVADQLQALPLAEALVATKLIHNQSANDYLEWSRQLSRSLSLEKTLAVPIKVKVPKLQQFKILDRQIDGQGDEPTYILTLQVLSSVRFTAGDLLSFYPKEDPIRRPYSVGNDQQGNIVLAIKRHEYGVVSNWLLDASVDEVVPAIIERNAHFHLPKTDKPVLMIANGTGIGPFLGMIQQDKQLDLRLLWGGRTRQSYSIYQSFIEQALSNQRLQYFRSVYSREGDSHRYVQDVLEEVEALSILKLGGTLMICGSIAMYNGVLDRLGQLLQDDQYEFTLQDYIDQGRIRSDCY
ncbi:MAG: NADPH cytochrome P450 oxidoreductase family protein, partial [Bacteroidota bacterium]